ncbi:MAG: multidrug transporter [Bryobacteraceae bacterium]|nr:MAG: multidrug transporter [Bryobacteraceae bacterium]
MTRALALLAAALPLAAQEPLRLEEVLESVDRHYPPLLAALQDRVLAAADVLVASGRFDLSLKSGYEGDYLGKYRNDVYRAGVEQATQFQGMTYFAGYQLGRGEFASYDGKLQTDLGGEYKAGVRLPLFRDRAIDARRADLQKALIGRRVADLGVDQQRLVIIQLATRRYYDWVAAGQRYNVAKAVLQVAEQRDGQLREAARLGQIPAIDVTDNQRAILTRRAQLIEAERALQQASIELSLFYRDSSGSPVLPPVERLPSSFPAARDIDEQRLRDDIELALKRRPEIQRFREQRNQVEVDRRLAQNQLLPNIDLSLSFTSQLGERRVGRGPNDLVAALVFDLPAQRRVAKGRDLSALARIEQFDQRERFARDQVEAEVRDAYSALKTAYDRARVLREEVEVARQLEVAERVRFELGEGNLFLVNLREQATYETELREVAALTEYFRALALYEFAIAEAMSRPRKP